jgi:hypothetical protein
MRDGIGESRDSCRYDAVQPMVYLGWWEEPEFRTFAAELRNVSNGGALVVAPVSPPEAGELWICMSGAASSGGDWAEVSVVSVADEPDGLYHVRLRFKASCPYEMFTLAVHGISVGI